jgi:EAL domain-containing protein (putative c-di-GMP-specific phosphodiesterase class I)
MIATLQDVVQALHADRVMPVFQPQIDLRTGKTVSFEVLARWDHPLHGPVLPSNFIALAEGNGLIGELTHQVLRKAFHVADRFLPQDLTLAINVSPVQLHYATLPAQIRMSAEDAGFDLDCLTMEVTESALVSNLDVASRVANGLRNLGCRLALDDFGTGYSSLLHLQALPFTDLKVDRSFIGNMTSARQARKIVSAVVGLGQSLGLTTIGEGVETEEQAEMLFRLGCDQGQGWLFGKPLSAQSIPSLISAEPWQPSAACLNAFSEPFDPAFSHRAAELQAIYESIPVALLLLDTNLRCMSANTRFAKLYQLPLDAVPGRNLREIIPRGFQSFEPHIRRAILGEGASGVPLIAPSLSNANGTQLVAAYQPAFDETGEVIGVSVAMIEMSYQNLYPNAFRSMELVN